jgi:hypothetical protein
MTDSFSNEDLWQMATEAPQPATPIQDDMESVLRIYHKKMAELALAHHEEKDRALSERHIHCMVMINGKACDPELELRLAELEGFKEQAIMQMKRICAMQMASVLLHHERD